MGEAKATAEASGKTLAERQKEQVDQAERTGWSEFLALIFADPGRDIPGRVFKRALLGLGRRIEAVEDGARQGLHAARAAASVMSRQILGLYARQEVMLDSAKAQKEAIAHALAQVVERQDHDSRVLANFMRDMTAWADAERARAGLGWLKRRKAPLPPLPPVRAVHGPLTLQIPAVPDLPALPGPEEEDRAPQPPTRRLQAVPPPPATPPEGEAPTDAPGAPGEAAAP